MSTHMHDADRDCVIEGLACAKILSLRVFMVVEAPADKAKQRDFLCKILKQGALVAYTCVQVCPKNSISASDSCLTANPIIAWVIHTLFPYVFVHYALLVLHVYIVV